MTEEVWRPLGHTGEETARYDALHEGIPVWMEESFWTWMKPQFTVTGRASPTTGYTAFDAPLLLAVERACRLRIGRVDTDVSKGVAHLRGMLGNKDAPLEVADYLLSRGDSKGASILDRLLQESGSAWKVGERAGKPGLVRRVPEGVQTNADAVMASTGNAGATLAEAWGRAFGINPDPIGAYALAVRAVEHASIPLVVPKQKDSTLGHVVGQLERDADWSLPFNLQDDRARTADVVVAMCRALFKGHDHHGGSDNPGRVTQDEAEAAVTLAVPLVQWFASGMVARR
jgi:hypothetical protein